MPRRRSLIVSMASVAAAVGLLAGAVAEDRPSWSKEVSGPGVGPAGQTGELHYLENPAKPYQGGARQFGPYRLLPPGTRYIERDYPADTAPREFTETADPSLFTGSELYIPPLAGYAEKSANAVLRNSTPILVQLSWASAEIALQVVVTAAPEWQMPLDVYLHFEDSPITVRSEMLSGHFAIVTEPTAGPAPNVGSVRVWLGGREIFLSSPNAGQDRLRVIAETILAGAAGRGGPQ